MDDKKKISLLIADDHAITRDGIKTLLKVYDEFQLAGEACNGEEGLEQVRRYQPKLILLDVMMPKMDGYDLCKIIKNDIDLQSIYIVMLTAKGQKVDEEKAIQMGADAYMTKPFDAEEVLWHIDRVFNSNEQEQN